MARARDACGDRSRLPLSLFSLLLLRLPRLLHRAQELPRQRQDNDRKNRKDWIFFGKGSVDVDDDVEFFFLSRQSRSKPPRLSPLSLDVDREAKISPWIR